MNIEEFVVASVMLDMSQDCPKFDSDDIEQLQENNKAEEPVFVSSSYDVDASKVSSSVTGTFLAYPPLTTAWTRPLAIYTLAVVKPEVRTSPVILTDITVNFTVELRLGLGLGLRIQLWLHCFSDYIKERDREDRERLFF